MIEEIKKELFKNQDEKYQKFSSSLLPNIENVLGVRFPILKKIAKKIAKNDYELFFRENDNEFLELTLLEAMVLGFIGEDFNYIKNHLKKFIKKINCWSVCDTLCSNLKIVKEHKNETKEFIEKYFNSKNEYEIRFCYVILLNYFIESDFDYVTDKLSLFNNEQYYAKMAAAWCLSYCFMYDFNKTLKMIKNKKIHPWVLKKGILKTRESFKISKEQKEILKIISL